MKVSKHGRSDLAGRLPVMGDGCDLHGHCLACPLPRCQFDDGIRRDTARRLLEWERHGAMGPQRAAK